MDTKVVVQTVGHPILNYQHHVYSIKTHVLTPTPAKSSGEMNMMSLFAFKQEQHDVTKDLS